MGHKVGALSESTVKLEPFIHPLPHGHRECFDHLSERCDLSVCLLFMFNRLHDEIIDSCYLLLKEAIAIYIIGKRSGWWADDRLSSWQRLSRR